MSSDLSDFFQKLKEKVQVVRNVTGHLVLFVHVDCTDVI